LWRLTSQGIGVKAVVVDVELREPGEQSNQIRAAADVALADSPLGDVVSSAQHPGPYTGQMQLRVLQSHVPNPNLEACLERPVEQRCDRLATERGLECEVASLGDRSLQQILPHQPSLLIGFLLVQPRMRFPELPSRRVRVVELDLALLEDCA